jgi:hypothetical protein
MAHECLEKRGLTDKRPIIADRDNLYGPRALCPGSYAWVWRASAKAGGRRPPPISRFNSKAGLTDLGSESTFFHPHKRAETS